MMKSRHLDARPEDLLLTFEEAAVALHGSRRIVESAVRRGDLAIVRLGNRCVRVSRAALDAYILKKARR